MDNQTPSTKADIAALMDSIGKLYDANECWKDEIIRHFDVTVENIRHDLEGANKDDIELLKDAKNRRAERIQRLERHVGIVA